MSNLIRFKEGCKILNDVANDRIRNSIDNHRLYNGEQSKVYLDAFIDRLKMNGVSHYTTGSDGQKFDLSYDNSVVSGYYGNILQGINYTKAVCNLYSNLLFSEGINVSDYDDVRNSWLNGEENERGQKISKGFMKDSDLQRKLLSGQNTNGLIGNAVYLITAKENDRKESGLKAEIIKKSTDKWFPVSSDDDYSIKTGDALVEQYDIDNDDQKSFGFKTPSSNRKVLRVVIYEVGKNTYKAFICDNGVLSKQIAWDQSTLGKLPEGATQEEDSLDWVEETGYNYSMLQVVYNDRSDEVGFGRGFITESFKQQEREICIRATQRARILDKNSDPGMTGPEQNIGIDPTSGNPIVQTSGKYIPAKKDDVPVSYVTWDGNLADNVEAEKKAKEYIHVETGTNDASLSATAEGLATLSGSALEKVLMRPLSVTKTLIIQWTPVIENILRLSYQIETNKDELFPDIQWNDGLPSSREQDLKNIMTANGNLPIMTHADSIQVAFPGYTRQQANNQAKLIDAETKKREVPLIEVPELL